MLLEGRQTSLNLQKHHKQQAHILPKGAYMAVLFFGGNYSSATYVRHKQKYGETMGIDVKIFTEENSPALINREGVRGWVTGILSLITSLNHDPLCGWIIIQLPLPDALKTHKTTLLAAISPTKDIDGLGGICTGLSSIDLIDFTPATPKAVLTLLDAYNLGDMKGKTVSIIGQSNIVGKPLILECIKRWATVSSFNIENTPEEIKEITRHSDYIISCTGQVHLIDETYIGDKKNQIILDVGYGHIDGKPVGDVNIDKIKDKVLAYTPVPGGIGPLTVACLFDNIFVLHNYKEILAPYAL